MRESNYNLWVDRGDDQYVYNTVSGKLIHLSKQRRDGLADFLERGSMQGVTTEILEGLVENRVLVSDQTDELRVLEGRWKAGRFDPSRLGLTILTSLGCNFDCPYCFEDKRPSLIAPETADKVVELLEQHAERLDKFSVTWFGGEPLLGKDALFELSDRFLDICGRHDIEYSANIITNGWHLDAETARGLAERGVTTAQVTIDGPPDIHNEMRPHVAGLPTFDRVVGNIAEAIEHLSVNVRVSIDRDSARRVKELFELFIARGIAGRVNVYPGHLIDYDHHEAAPAATYQGSCMSRPEFAAAEREFFDLARSMGLSDGAGLPHPIAAPCTAVRANELIVGSEGELYKCWDDVGNPAEEIGHIRDYTDINGRLHRWLAYDPFQNDECRSCVSLPVCMGGCAHHAMLPNQYENRCGTFKHEHRDLLESIVDDILDPDRIVTPQLDLLEPRPSEPSPGVAVTIGRKPQPVG